MRRFVRATVALSTLVTFDVAAVQAQPAVAPSHQPPAQPEPDAESDRGTLMAPGQGFGAAYGTDNLAGSSVRRQPSAEQPGSEPHAALTLQKLGDALNARVLSTFGLAVFNYQHSNPLLQMVQNSAVDLTSDSMLLVLLFWNQTALEMIPVS